MSNVSSPALLTRMLGERMRTVLIDEADRSLNPKNEGIGEIIAVINSGYKQGATRPTLVPSKEHGWISKELPTYSPVVMAGNGPQLPDDTLSRCIPIGLLPSDEVEESDWEEIEADAADLGLALTEWAAQFLDSAPPKVTLPEQVKARAKERWRPLKRVAVLAGGRWPEVADALAADDVQRVEDERESGLSADRPHIVLVQHLAEVWPAGENFMEVSEMVDRLIWNHPEMWGEASSFGKPLSAHRLGIMLNRNYRVTSVQPTRGAPRGHGYATMARIWKRLGVTPPPPPREADASDDAMPLMQKGMEGSSEPSEHQVHQLPQGGSATPIPAEDPLPGRSAHPAEPAHPAQNGQAESQNSHESHLSRPHQEGVGATDTTESEPTNGRDADLQRVLDLWPIDTPTLARQTGWGVQKSALMIQKARNMEATR